MTSCNYRVLNDIYHTVEDQLADISQKIENIEVNVDIGEFDIDLDNIELQLEIANKLKFLELIGTDIMNEDDQISAYQAIMTQLFAPSGSSDPMVEEEEELDGPTEFGVEGPSLTEEEGEF